jgi:hypothetical protein
MNVVGEFSRQFGLGAIAQELGVEFTAHRAVDDAYATMKVAEAMCKAEGLNFMQLLEKYQITTGRIENYEIRQNTSVGYAQYKQEQERRKEERERRKAEFHVFADKEKRRRAKVGKLKNKRVCFSHPLELQTELAKSLLLKAFAQGAFYSFRAEECDAYVCFETENGQRLKSAQAVNARIFTPDEFAEFLQ